MYYLDLRLRCEWYDSNKELYEILEAGLKYRNLLHVTMDTLVFMTYLLEHAYIRAARVKQY